MTPTVRRTAAVALLVTAATLAACGSDAAVKETNDGKVSVTGKGDRTKVTVNGENGAAATYNATVVPSSFPADVPLPAGLALRNATSATRGGKHFFQLSYDLKTSARAALGAYATRLGDAGFSADAADGPTSDNAPSPLRAEGKGWHVVAIATSGKGVHSMIVTANDA